jgi:hypothetical protein
LNRPLGKSLTFRDLADGRNGRHLPLLFGDLRILLSKQIAGIKITIS